MNYIKTMIIIFPAFFANLQAQVTVGKVSYRRILNLDSTQQSLDSIGTRAVLFFKQGQSIFIYNCTSINKNDSMPTVKNEPNTYDMESSDKYGESVFMDYTRQKITIREFVWKKPYITEEPIPFIKWTVEKESKYFGKIVCHKATASFRGRIYTAWFTYDIPINTGPWKLQGLPGLILEVADSKNEVQYKFESIDIPTNETVSFQPATNGKKVVFNEFKQLWVRETEKLRKFLQSTAEKGATIDMDMKYYPIEKTYE